MKVPLTISTRNVDISSDVEELIREKSEKLDNVYDNIISCRVKVDVPHRSQRTGVLYDIRIDILVPGGEVVIRREPDQDLHVAVVNAFETAQRRLKEHAEKQRGDVKTHSEKPLARVSKVFPLDGYGFLTTPEGTEIFFHENAVLNAKFDDLEEGTLVNYIEHQGEKGPQASSVTVVSST